MVMEHTTDYTKNLVATLTSLATDIKAIDDAQRARTMETARLAMADAERHRVDVDEILRRFPWIR